MSLGIIKQATWWSCWPVNLLVLVCEEVAQQGWRRLPEKQKYNVFYLLLNQNERYFLSFPHTILLSFQLG